MTPCRLPTTMRRLRGSCSASSRVRAPSLSSVTSVASSSWVASGSPWGLPQRGDREPRTTNVADDGHDLDRLAIGVLLVPFGEEQAAARGSRQAAQ